MTIMCVFIWLVEGWAFFHLIMIMCLYITYIYIIIVSLYFLYTDLYIKYHKIKKYLGLIYGC